VNNKEAVKATLTNLTMLIGRCSYTMSKINCMKLFDADIMK